MKILLVTPEYAPEGGGLGVSAKRLSDLFTEEPCIDLYVVHLLGTHDMPPLGSHVKIKENNFYELFYSYEVPDYQQRMEIFEGIEHIYANIKFDLIHCFGASIVGSLGALVATHLKIPLVLSIRGNDIGKHMFSNNKLSLLQVALNKASWVTSVSRDLIEIADTIAPVIRKSSVVYNSILPANSYEKTFNEKFTVGAVFSSRIKKGYSIFLDAVKNSSQQYSFVTIGSTNADFERENHTYLGRLERPQMLEEIARLDCLVMPSLFSEGHPNLMLEAIQQKTPIIATRSGALGDLLSKEMAVLIEKCSSDAILRAIELLENNPDLGKELAENALKILEFCTPEKEKASYLNIYRSILGLSRIKSEWPNTCSI